MRHDASAYFCERQGAATTMSAAGRGQVNAVQIPAGTIDEKIYQRQLMKGELADAMQQEQGAKKASLFFFLVCILTLPKCHLCAGMPCRRVLCASPLDYEISAP